MFQFQADAIRQRIEVVYPEIMAKLRAGTDNYIWDSFGSVEKVGENYLFLYSDHVDEATHLASMRELCRVASEVRVFPFMSLDGTASKHLDVVMTALSEEGIDVSLQPVSYRFQKRATEILVAKRRP